MGSPSWVPPAGGRDDDGDDAQRGYRGAHSSDGTDSPDAASASPDSASAGSAGPDPAGRANGPADDVWGGPNAPQPWGVAGSGMTGTGGQPAWGAAGGAADPWSAAGPWGAPADDTRPAYPMPQPAQPAAQPPAEPAPAPGAAAEPPTAPPAPAAPAPPAQPAQPWAAAATGTPGYGPVAFNDPAGPTAGPAVGEPAWAAGPTAAPSSSPAPSAPAAPTNDGGSPTRSDVRSDLRPDGAPFQSVRSEAVPPAGSGFTPAEADPTPRPPQPEPPAGVEVPVYAARLAEPPRPTDAGPPPNGPAGFGTSPETAPSGWNPGGAANAWAPNGPAGPGGSGQPQPGQPQPGQPQPGQQGPAHAVGGTPPPAAMPQPEDLLVSSRPRALEKPATWGWRGRLARMSGGLYKPRPSAAEIADRQSKLNAQRSFSRPMTVVVIQPKGGAGKTPTTICVASALGVRRGGYIVGWDNNETRGTLAVRTSNDDNQRTTAWDLLGRLDEFERSEARVGDLSYYMRAQGAAQFDALVSDDNPGNMAQIGEVEFKRIHQVLQRFYRMIIVDTGNNVRSPNWQAAVDHADQIVVVSTYQRDVGYSGSWVLNHLEQTGRAELARNAITVLTAAEPTTDAQVAGALREHFSSRTRAVVEVPYDPHIAEGGPIRWDELSQASQRAWTAAAAAITQTLYERDQRALAGGAPRG